MAEYVEIDRDNQRRREASRVARLRVVGEALGVALFSAGAALAWEPLGLMLAGSYVMLLANRQPGNGGRE